MKNINWKVRFKNPQFWIALIPAILVLAQRILSLFGVDIAVDLLGQELVLIVELLFIVLAILGIVEDPVTHGIKDSKQALTYDKPRKDD